MLYTGKVHELLLWNVKGPVIVCEDKVDSSLGDQ